VTILHRAPPRVHSNPGHGLEPGPTLLAVGRAAGYASCGLTEAAVHHGRYGTTIGCPAIEPEDSDLLDEACEADGPCEPRLPLAEWAETQASWFRSQRTAAGDWLAAEIQELADLARALHSTTPEQFADRRQAMNHEFPRCDRDDLVGLSYADVVL
jgi:hypothetical protein